MTVLLDRYTTDPHFTLSKDSTRVLWDKDVEDDPVSWKKNSNTWTVWGSEGFTGGCKYWEAAVSPGTVWSIGLAQQHMATGRWDRLLTKDGYWTLMLWNRKSLGRQIRTLGTSIIIAELSKVGVYLDYEGGKVSFYNLENSSHLYTHNDKFTTPLFPFFKLWVGTFKDSSLTVS
ncbi:E3 ubiquitin-protein ligase TRIM69-like [Hypanus sabinus]|uniref:E3 ubiquitin-protein ligase TRIM69-like n=1 Tax=Hypanus sabinus TaxID=79690 RepID=UPI0028C41E73|nr:E3 ubiquitin-protein ligase TRIM69-like [Hypanus sabinus]